MIPQEAGGTRRLVPPYRTVRGENEEDQFYTGVALVESDVGEEPEYCTNTYQICIADADEGGIKVDYFQRQADAVSAEEALTAILTFNDEVVIETFPVIYPDSSLMPTELIEGEKYSLSVPKYGCVITRFKTMKRFQGGI